MSCAVMAVFVAMSLAGPGRDVNAFQRLNPNYKQRAGGFYEEEYLGPASRSLARAVGLKDAQHKEATGILKQFIYEWLDGYVSGGGEISADAHRRVLERMDGRFRKLLTEEQFRGYLRWREGKVGENALGFLMRR